LLMVGTVGSRHRPHPRPASAIRCDGTAHVAAGADAAARARRRALPAHSRERAQAGQFGGILEMCALYFTASPVRQPGQRTIAGMLVRAAPRWANWNYGAGWMAG